eukprot:TRINITY_DN49941_c0_g1_i1.p1 TRINITY_DN49941_c0_g1~~TRINITY_DN49941_c0_g1_i1.p1  ORF type:complete len:570 (+),score=204.21 TRINITY_DN49941_c0_g1_i1:76-1785(+)
MLRDPGAVRCSFLAWQEEAQEAAAEAEKLQPEERLWDAHQLAPAGERARQAAARCAQLAAFGQELYNGAERSDRAQLWGLLQQLQVGHRKAELAAFLAEELSQGRLSPARLAHILPDYDRQRAARESEQRALFTAAATWQEIALQCGGPPPAPPPGAPEPSLAGQLRAAAGCPQQLAALSEHVLQRPGGAVPVLCCEVLGGHAGLQAAPQRLLSACGLPRASVFDAPQYATPPALGQSVGVHLGDCGPVEGRVERLHPDGSVEVRAGDLLKLSADQLAGPDPAGGLVDLQRAAVHCALLIAGGDGPGSSAERWAARHVCGALAEVAGALWAADFERHPHRRPFMPPQPPRGGPHVAAALKDLLAVYTTVLWGRAEALRGAQRERQQLFACIHRTLSWDVWRAPWAADAAPAHPLTGLTGLAAAQLRAAVGSANCRDPAALWSGLGAAGELMSQAPAAVALVIYWSLRDGRDPAPMLRAPLLQAQQQEAVGALLELLQQEQHAGELPFDPAALQLDLLLSRHRHTDAYALGQKVRSATGHAIAAALKDSLTPGDLAMADHLGEGGDTPME